MLAMDVVDTLRHGEALAERELSGEARRAQMIERLREIYRGQGISVPDRILEEGVDALEQDRFVYKPRTGGFAFTLARLYVRRVRIARVVGIVAAIALVLWGGWYFLVQQPRLRTSEAQRIELSETIPQRINQLREQIDAIAEEPGAAAQAGTTAEDGLNAARSGNVEIARRAVETLETVLSELQQSYEVRIVSRPGEDTGITRIPDDNPRAENFYLIVEAVGSDGQVIPRRIRNEENQQFEQVSKWGVHVSQDVWEAVADDKRDDGIVQDSLMGTKPRGYINVDWAKPTLDGFITSW
jgi:hypothetical protein